MILQTTLSLAAAAAIINQWIGFRCGQVRMSEKIIHGDGGNAHMARRMRAHSNFTENVPLTLVLIAAIELTGKGDLWLAVVGALFLLGRVTHALGMDNPSANPLRVFGALSASLSQLGLAVMALLIALGQF